MRSLVTKPSRPRTTFPLLGLLVAACVPAAVSSAQQQPQPQEVLLMASTIGPIDAGIVGALEDAYGNAPTTRYANERQAYVLMDRATVLTLKKEIGLQVLVEKDPDLLNYIAVIRMNPARFPRTNSAGASAFVDWLVSDEAQRLIRSFGADQYGESLFFPNSDEWRKRHPG